MKSQVSALLSVIEGVLKDASLVYPELKDSLAKDLARLTLNCRARGLSTLTLDLPSLESNLLVGLECGRLPLCGPLSHRVSHRTMVPRLFSGLWLRVFDKRSVLKREVDVNAIFFLRQLLTIGKRIEINCSYSRISAKVEEYHDIDGRLRLPTLEWDGDSLFTGDDRCNRSGDVNAGNYQYCLPYYDQLDLFGLSDEHYRTSRVEYPRLLSLHLREAIAPGLPLFGGVKYPDEAGSDIRLLSQIQQVADLLFGSLDHPNPVEHSAQWEADGKGIGFRHGPGAVAERLRNHEKSWFPNWPQKLEGYFPFDRCGRTVGDPRARPSKHEMAARLLCVPKTAKGPRLIAAEPVAHQWCQQYLMRFLFSQVRRSVFGLFIDFQDQHKSGELVLSGSLNSDLATVDLSDASDRLSCWTIERMVRSNTPLLSALHAARTRYVRDDILKHSSFLKLRKFASQGTATTFPVMSMVMTCIALGASLSADEEVTVANLRKLRNRVRVFGDDIVIPVRGYTRLRRAMELLELKVNEAKSYVHGQFRESCGMDGFQGYCVTPVRPKTLVADSPASCQAVVDTSNNLFNKGLFHASQSAEALLPDFVRKRIRIVGYNEAGFSGFSSFSGSDERHLRTRWNPRLHRNEVRVWSIQDRIQKSERDGFGALLDFCSRAYNPCNPRIVSDYASIRKTKAGLLWEPQNSSSAGPL